MLSAARSTCQCCGAPIVYLPGTLAVRCQSCGGVAHVEELGGSPTSAKAPVHVNVHLTVPTTPPGPLHQHRVSDPDIATSADSPRNLVEAQDAVARWKSAEDAWGVFAAFVGLGAIACLGIVLAGRVAVGWLLLSACLALMLGCATFRLGARAVKCARRRESAARWVALWEEQMRVAASRGLGRPH